MRQADAKTRAYEVTGAYDGCQRQVSYRREMAGGNKEMLEVVDFLVAKERDLLLN